MLSGRDQPAIAPEKQVTPARRLNPALAPIADTENLPRVLLIGDSISIGYTLPVRELLSGKANVHRIPENGGPTTRGIEKLDQWLGDRPWDVIHFNFGLHDLKYINDEGKMDKENGHPQVPPNEYENKLTRIVERLRSTNATLIWCTTTPVPPGAAGRNEEDAAKYNAIAARVIRRTLGEDRIINDLYSFAQAQLDQIQRPANVHFTESGSHALANEVARTIANHLPRSESDANEMATGIVYHDTNGNGTFDAPDRPLPSIRVSNGKTIVITGQDGKYQLPIDDDTILFIIKPRGWCTALSTEMLPRFYYIHKPKGSPDSRYAGVPPTGPLPDSIDFPLYPQPEPDQFNVIFFGDPQSRNQTEIDYLAHDIVEELIGTDASFGVSLGDIAFDNLNVFESQNRAIAQLNIPWFNVIGNHDLNYDAEHDTQSDETFERVFGPSYYAFDYGPVHFLVLDDVEWLIDEKSLREQLIRHGGDPNKVFRNIRAPSWSWHIWQAKLPADLPAGTHRITIRATDMHRQIDLAYRLFRVID